MQILALISIILFWLLFIGRTMMLAARGVKVWQIGQNKNWLERLLMPGLVLFSVFLVLTCFGVEMWAPLFSYYQMPLLPVLGLILCYASLVWFVAALISFGNAWRVGIDSQGSNSLITSGVFKVSRNPIFLFMDCYFLGIALVFPSNFFLLALVVAILGLHRQILQEEKFLAQKFGASYQTYTAKTRRYL